MKIESVSAVPVAFAWPPSEYQREGQGTSIHRDGRRSRVTPRRPSLVREYVLVRIETDEGVTGVGEAQCDIGFFGETLEEVRFAIDDYLGPQLVGKDPFDREHLLRLIDYRGNTCARAGIDLALHDLLGRALGAPVSVLLGGTHRRRIPVSVEIAAGTPDEMAAACDSYLARGVRAFKAKIGGDPQQDALRIRVIREAIGPDVSLRADANEGYTPKAAIRFCRVVERFDAGLELLEQPVPAWDLHGMAAVRRSVDTPIEADESCYSVHDAMQIIRLDAADVLNVKLGKAGGLYAAKKIAALAEAAGLGCVLGTAFGVGPEIAAKLHLAASTLAVTDAVEFTELGLHANLLAAPWSERLSLPLEDGCLPVPDAPGLGVELDELAVTRADI